MVSQPPEQDFARRVRQLRERVDARLERVLSGGGEVPERLAAAMRYAVLGPGKRIRPLLSYASGELFGLAVERVDAAAVAVELLHAYSLVHDDLPAMDDDDLRRGRPTTHRKYGEAMAILVGDALQARAFEVLGRDAVEAGPTAGPGAAAATSGAAARSGIAAHSGAAAAGMIRRLARAAGPAGMVGGQVLDLQAEGRGVDEAALADIHRRKTGELIRAAILMPAELAAAAPATLRSLDEFAGRIGVAFQIRDDLLEVEADTAAIGKSAGSDERNRKSTYPAILGAPGARRRAGEVHAAAIAALDGLGERAAGLRWIADFIVNRTR